MMRTKIMLGTALLLLLPLALPLSAWKPNQHVAFGLAIIHELEQRGGALEVNGGIYPVNDLAKQAICDFPAHYLWGCIGPDAYADIYFGQCIVHPDTLWTESSPWSYSDYWLRQLLQFARLNRAVDGGRALAFAYGFISHAAGDMWCHTFINRYAGGVWPAVRSDEDLYIPVRHFVMEGYVDDITGSIAKAAFRDYPGEWSYRHDDPYIHEFIYWALINSGFARTYDSSMHFNLFRLLKEKLAAARSNSFVGGLDDIIDAANKALPPGAPHAPTITNYLNSWITQIDYGLQSWVRVSSDVAYDLFFVGGRDGFEAAGDRLQEWVSGSLLRMLGAPDIVADLAKALNALNMSFEDFKKELLAKTGLDEVQKELEGIRDDLMNWMFKKAFGMTLDELKAFWLDPANWLDDASWFGGAPFQMNTKSELDAELAYALAGDAFDPLKFDASYNTIMASKLLLFHGPVLNQLLADHGYEGEPLYSADPMTNPEEGSMCALLGFMKSLDADHQWMKESPDTQEWGLGRMWVWENEEAREKVFKKVFHLGLDMEIITTPQMVLTPGTPERLEVKLVNTENRDDSFRVDLTFGDPLIEDSLGQNAVPVSPGAPQTLSIAVTAPRDCHLAPGIYDFTIEGRSVGRDWLPYDLVPEKFERGTVEVLPFYEPDIEASPGARTVAPGGTGSYTIGLTNKGNVSDAFQISRTYRDFGGAYFAFPTVLQPGWVTIGTTEMSLANCASQSTGLTIAIPSDWAGMEAATYEAEIGAQSAGDPGAEDVALVAITVQPTKESKTRYLDLELLWLRDLVASAAIEPSVKDSLLGQLGEAINKKEQALAHLLRGRRMLANNMLNACQEIVKAFGYVVKAQDEKAVPAATADTLIAKAAVLWSHIAETIVTE